MDYLEGNTYTIGGKKKIYQVDGTFRDASIVNPPMPDSYVFPKKSTGKVVGNGGTTEHFNDGTSTFTRDQVNQNGLTVAQMVAKANAQTTPTSTVKYNPDGSRTLTGAEKQLSDYFNAHSPLSQSQIDSQNAQIRANQLKQQQEAINGINAMYQNILAQASQENQSRLGSTALINSLSGQRGSASGAATTNKTMEKNRSVISAIDAEKAAKISQIRNDYQNQIDTRITNARALRTKDANAWIQYQAGEVDRKKIDAKNLRAQYISALLNPDDIDDDAYKEMAEAGGYSLEQSKALYKAEYEKAQKDFVAKENKTLLDLDKERADIAASKASAATKNPDLIMAQRGYKYVDPKERDILKKQGREMFEAGGRTYAAPKKEVKSITKSSNFTSTTIPTKVKSQLLYDKGKGATIDQLFAAYPDVSTSYIQSLFRDPTKLTF